MTNKQAHKMIREGYTYNMYTPYESYLYNKGWIDCFEYMKHDINISNCHTLNGMLLDEYNKLIK